MVEYNFAGAPRDVLTEISGYTNEGKTLDEAIDLARASYYGSKKEFNEVLSAMRGDLTTAKRGGHMYEVNLNVDPDDLLDWDLPLGEQNEAIQKAFDGIPDIDTSKAGSDALWRLKRSKYSVPESMPINTASDADQWAAMELKKRGIPGIKYLDQFSRGAGGWHITPPTETVSGKWMLKGSDVNSKGLQFATEAEAQTALAKKLGDETRNYVMFDDSLIDIARKYGFPLTAVGLAAAARVQERQRGNDGIDFARDAIESAGGANL